MKRALVILFACSVASGGVVQESAGARITMTGSMDYWWCPTIVPGNLTRLYVVAELSAGACGGITEAEFRIAGFPTEAEHCFVNPVWPVGITPVGDPFVEGVRLDFPCATPESGRVVLFSFDVIALAQFADRRVQLVAYQMPSDVQFAYPVGPCPNLTLCTGTRIAAGPTEIWLNDTSGRC
jgi:hypothetical protein